MATATNKKKALKKVAKKHPVKNTKKAASKSKKQVKPKSKPTAKKVKRKVVLKKQSTVKKKTTVKKAVKKSAKKVVKKVSKKPAKRVVKKVIKKVIKKVVKKAAPKKTILKKKIVVKKKAVKSPVKKVAPQKKSKPILKILKKVKPLAKSKPTSAKELIRPKKDRNEFDKKMELKAQRIMKELEERMDIAKVKPRISATTSVPKPKPVPPVVKLPEPENTIKEKFQMEFELRSSKNILFYYLSDSSGLAGWFADDVKEKDGRFTFSWEGSEQVAKLVATRDNSLVRFQWESETDGTYFQFEIKEDDITSDIALIITDWANPGERDSNSKLWESQVHDLRQLIGS